MNGEFGRNIELHQNHRKTSRHSFIEKVIVRK